jgi:GAF domain-containing protein
MHKAPVPRDEQRRLQILRDYQILDTAAEKVFDDITSLAANVCNAPICLLTFVDADRQWFKSNVGLAVKETSREYSFCSHALLEPDIFVVPDARADERFADNPLVTGEPSIRFYAGVPLRTPEGAAVGTLCVIDREPRQLTQQQLDKIKALAASAVLLLEMRRARPPQRLDNSAT